VNDTIVVASGGCQARAAACDAVAGGSGVSHATNAKSAVAANDHRGYII